MKKKFLIVFSIMVLLLIFQGIFSAYNTHRNNMAYASFLNTIQELNDREVSLINLRLLVFQYLGTTNAEELKTLEKKINSFLKK